jgi:hypothetical protein
VPGQVSRPRPAHGRSAAVNARASDRARKGPAPGPRPEPQPSPPRVATGAARAARPGLALGTSSARRARVRPGTRADRAGAVQTNRPGQAGGLTVPEHRGAAARAQGPKPAAKGGQPVLPDPALARVRARVLATVRRLAGTPNPAPNPVQSLGPNPAGAQSGKEPKHNRRVRNRCVRVAVLPSLTQSAAYPHSGGGAVASAPGRGVEYLGTAETARDVEGPATNLVPVVDGADRLCLGGGGLRAWRDALAAPTAPVATRGRLLRHHVPM